MPKNLKETLKHILASLFISIVHNFKFKKKYILLKANDKLKIIIRHLVAESSRVVVVVVVVVAWAFAGGWGFNGRVTPMACL
jgi:hypothetical protein